ncbi:MAG TPA: hypothetical protein VJ276_06780 [Thermoanaerobaculia bacterium]|nr:hypothetical protein [Thermoanaerobaculia bacterium]
MNEGVVIADAAAAAAFAREMLAGGGSLSRLLLPLATEGAEWRTLLRDGAGVADFESGGHYPGRRIGYVEEVVSDNARLAALVARYLTTNDDAFALFEDPLARPSDPFVSRLRSTVVPYEDSVLLAVRPPADVDAVLLAIREAKRVPSFTGVLGVGDPFRPGGMERIAEMAKILVLGAYDGESYILTVVRS